ncbi:MAG: hypothetical protein HC888_11970 [Candidatus Competibacteraceae bacterium]|nr:hypothetical protein [Candidatus Competibacteraceae bacterium]
MSERPVEGSVEESAELELLKADVRGRVRVPGAKREAILDVFEQSGLSGPAFAKQWGLKYPTFASWVQRRHRCGREVQEVRRTGPAKPVTLVEAVVGGRALCRIGA